MDLLKKRAERFGIQPGSKIEQVTVSFKSVCSFSVDCLILFLQLLMFSTKLKSLFVLQVEMEERKRKRLERFGAASSGTNGASKVSASKPDTAPVALKPGRIPITAPTATASASNKASVDEKKKQRAERFKTNTAVSAK